ncbi:hypothetical protein [Algoriphagus sediminis]|uniref:Uncharacterized protein n=1 Tax=Algoriphagus sediminis TaxID=3057113 RepID=A0ABT7YGJ2_9BACT|nr:hypothetical protein [Algoriphagus sediminis]MDN3205643.1 hypothetical protein [Algoriphagus sediminis]
MDIEFISQLLNSQETHGSWDHEEFLSQLGYAFEFFKENDDSELLVEPTYCNYLSCNPEFNRTVYIFSGNKSEHYIPLRFLSNPKSDLNDHEIIEILECRRVMGLNEEISPGLRIYLKTIKHRLEDLKHSRVEVWALQVDNAMKEYDSFQKPFIYSDVVKWVHDYYGCFKHYEDDYLDTGQELKQLQFLEIYLVFDLMVNIYEEISNFHPGLKELTIENAKDHFEGIFEIESAIRFSGIDKLFDIPAEKYGQSFCVDELDFGGEEFSQVGFFLNRFFQIQPILVKKYYALSVEETDQLLELERDFNPFLEIKLLQFHMDIRERARERGEEIPLNL